MIKKRRSSLQFLPMFLGQILKTVLNVETVLAFDVGNKVNQAGAVEIVITVWLGQRWGF